MLKVFNFRVILEYLPLYMKCFWATIWVSGLSIVGALLVGTLACAMRLSRSRLLTNAAGCYIESIRSTPLLAQIYFLYFGLPSLGFRISEEVTGVIALPLNSGAYMAEIIRAGIRSVPPGQIEAGMATGLATSCACATSSCRRRSAPPSRRSWDRPSSWSRTPRSCPSFRLRS